MPTMPNPEELVPIPHGIAGDWEGEYPLLCSYLIDPAWPDKKPRKPAKLFVSLEQGLWKWTLKEPNLGYILVATVDEPQLGLGALEAMLQGPKVPWMVDPWEQKQKAKRGR